MNENSANTEILIRYLDGELQGEELEILKINLANDQSIREEFENLQLARKAAWRFGLKSKINDIHSDMMLEIKDHGPKRVRVIRMLVQTSLRVAAVLIVLVGLSGLYQYFTTSPEKLFSENYQPYTIRAMRGESNNSTLLEKYRMGKMDSVILEFNSLNAPKPEEYILAGIAFLENNQPEKAIKTLKELIQKNTVSQTDYFEDDAEYYLAMSYLKNREPEKALPIFEKIQADPRHPYSSKLSRWFILKVKSLH